MRIFFLPSSWTGNYDLSSWNSRFVEKYSELKNKEGEMDEDLLFAETGKALLAEGLVLSRKGKNVSIQKQMPFFGITLEYRVCSCHK